MRRFLPFILTVSATITSSALGEESPAVETPIAEPLPKVLIIGDSISMGYTKPVQTLLKETADVRRIPANGGPTTRGLEHIEAWLGETNWDVIHFNWGLHDLKMMDGKTHQVPLEEYKENLDTLVKRLQQTRAKLIWCSTTPVPEKVNPPRTNADVLDYNAAAAAIMEKHGVAVSDLYTFARERLGDIQIPNNVHFTKVGSQALAEKVAAEIEAVLPKSP